jgi:hypothetical protein
MRRNHAMTAEPSIDVSGWLEQQLASASDGVMAAVTRTPAAKIVIETTAHLAALVTLAHARSGPAVVCSSPS